MSFYNPYMQKPDYAGGFSDFIQQMFQMMMYKKFMDQMGQQGGPQQDPNQGAIKQATGAGWGGYPERDRGIWEGVSNPPLQPEPQQQWQFPKPSQGLSPQLIQWLIQNAPKMQR